jgi:hypothetical protein
MSRSWLRRLFGRKVSPTRKSKIASQPLLRLEDRVTPAFNMTLSLAATNAAVSKATVAGTTTFTAIATGANLNFSDIGTELSAGHNVVVDSGSTGTEAGNIATSGFTGVSAGIPAGLSLTFQSGSGAGLVGDVNLPSISLSGANDILTVHAHGSISFISGGPFDTNAPSISLIADTGSVTNPNQTDATNLSISANTGIGVSGTPLKTQAANLVAQTATGGIFISNTGALNIGFAGDPFQGVKDTGASGDVSVTTTGGLTIGEPISSPGVVTLAVTTADATLQINSGPISGATVKVTADRMALGGQTFKAVLSGGQETPPNPSPGTGTGTLIVGADNTTITYNESWSGLLGPATAVHVHNAPPGVAGPVIYDATGVPAVTAGSIPQQTFAVTAAQLAQLQAGNFYTNIHSPVFPTGEIRGQFSLTPGAAFDIIASSAVTLQPFTSGRLIDLGSTTDAAANSLELSNTELNAISAGALVIGNGSDGGITVTAPITAAVGFNTLELVSGGAISSKGVGSVQATNLALSAVSGIGTFVPLPIALKTKAGNLVAQTSTGGIEIANTGDLTIGFAGEPFKGVQVTGASGDIQLNNSSGNVSITRNGDTIGGPAKVTVQTFTTGNITTGGLNGTPSGALHSSGGDVTLNAVQNTFIGDSSGGGAFGDVNTSGAGNIFLMAGGNINVDENSFVQANGTGNITATAGGNISLLHTHLVGVRIDTSGGTIILSTGAGGVFTSNTTFPPNIFSTNNGASGGDITISADDMVINDPINAGTGIVTLQQATVTTQAITLGGGGSGLGLSDAELGRITASVLRIGRSDNAGDITLDGQVKAHAGYSTLSLITGGAVLDTNATEPDIAVNSLAIRAINGISLDTAVSNLAVRNATAGNVRVANTGGVTLKAVDTVDGSPGNEEGDFAATGTTTFSAASPFTYAINFTSGSTINTTAGESATPSVDNITVNAAVTVQSTSGDVKFLAGDDIVINATASVLATSGNIDFRTGFADADNEGIMTINGTVSANATTGTVALNVNSSNSAVAAGTNIVSEGAAASITGSGLLLLNGVAGAPGPFALTSDLNSIGTFAAAINAAINFHNNGTLTVGSVNSPNEAITAFGIFTTGHDVTLQANDTINIAQTTNSGTANTTFTSTGGAIAQTLAGVGIVAGTATLNAANGIGGALAPIQTQVATLDANSTTGDINLKQSGGNVAVGQIDAVVGNVTLVNTAGTITSVSPNDGVAEVIGNTVTLDTSAAPSNGNTGQIGFFTASAQFFEVAATTLNAKTNNSRLWISALGGTAIGSVSAGTNTAFLRTVNGTLTSTHTGTTPDVVAAAVNLSMSPTATSGAFGTAANPLLIQGGSLTAKVIAGSGSINVSNVPAGGNLNVVAATTLSGPINLTVAGGNLTTTAGAGTDINAPGSTITLNVSGAVISGTPAGVTDVAAGSLAVTAGTGIGSALSPLKTAVTTLAFNNSAGSVTIANTGALTIDKVGSLATSDNTGTTTTLSAASPFTFAVNTSSALDMLASAVETNDPGVFADKLTVNAGVTVRSTAGNVTLEAGDDIVLNAGSLVKSDSGSVTLAAAFGDLDSEGGIAGNGTSTIQAGADITLNALNSISVGALKANAATGTVRLQTSGDVSQPGAGVITAGSLGVNAGGAITLPLDNVVGTFAAITAGAGKAIQFRTTAAETIGTVTKSAPFFTSDVNGVTTTTGAGDDIALNTDKGIAVNQAINSPGGTVRVQANGGDVTQTAPGTITGASLGVNAAGAIALQLDNAVSTFAAQSTVAGKAIQFRTTQAETIGTVTKLSPLFTADVSGVTTTIGAGNDITLNTDKSLAVNQVVTATSGTVRVQANGGDVTQTTPGTITGTSLGVNAAGAITLPLDNVISTFAAQSNVAGKAIQFRTTQAEAIGTVTKLSPLFTADVNGVTTTAGAGNDITLNTDATLAVNQTVSAPGGTVRIQAGSDVSQTAPGTIAGSSLGINSVGAITLPLDNAVSTFAAQSTVAGKAIQFRTTLAETIGTVAKSAPLFTTEVNGVTTTTGAGNDITLNTDKSLAVNQVVTSTGGTVRIFSGGDVSQTAIITGTAVGVQDTNGNIDLSSANVVSTFAADTSTVLGKSIAFQTTTLLNVGTVAKSAPLFPNDVSGATTKSADITLKSGGTTAINQPISDSTGANTVRLSSSGNVSQSAIVSSGALGIQDTSGSINLPLNNVVGTFAAHAPSDVSFTNTSALAIDTVAASTSLFTAAVPGVDSDSGSVTINGSSTLKVNQPVSALKGNVTFNTGDKMTLGANVAADPAAGIVKFHATTNGVSQTTGAVTGNSLLFLGDNAGPFNLTSALNDVSTFAALVNGAINIRDANDLTVGSVAGTTGIKTNNNGFTASTGTAFNTLSGTVINLGTSHGDVLMGLNDVNNTDQTKAYTSKIDGSAITDANGLTIRAGVASNSVEISSAVTGTFFLFGGTPHPTTVTAQSPGDRLSIGNSASRGITLLNYDATTGNGAFKFGPKGGAADAIVQFFDFEKFIGLTFQATAVQTGVGDYKIEANAVVNGQVQSASFSAPLPKLAPFLASPSLTNPFGPFDAPYISVGDVNGDGVTDIIIGFSSNSGSPLVTVVDGNTITKVGTQNQKLTTSNLLAQFFAYDPRYQGGVFVAAADFDGDGRAEIVTGPGQGQVPTSQGDGNFVKVFKFLPGQPISNNIALVTRFFAYDPTFLGGVRVAVGERSGSFIPGTSLHKPDIITSAGPGGGPLVRIFNGQALPVSTLADTKAGAAAAQFYAYDPSFTGGVFIDAGDYNNDGNSDILTGAGFGGGPHIKVFDGVAAFKQQPAKILDQFFDQLPPPSSPVDYQTALRAGVTSVGFGNFDGDGFIDIYVGSGLGVQNAVRIYVNNQEASALYDAHGNRIPNNDPFNPNTNPGEFRVDGAHVANSGAFVP